MCVCVCVCVIVIIIHLTHKLFAMLPRACAVKWLIGVASAFAGHGGEVVQLLGSLFMTNKPFAFY